MCFLLCLVIVLVLAVHTLEEHPAAWGRRVTQFD